MEGQALVKKLQSQGGSGKKQKGLPKRTRNTVRKARILRSLGKLAEKKLRHVLKRNGLHMAKRYVEEGRAPLALLRILCIQKGIEF